MLVRVKTACPDDAWLLRNPLTRPLYAWGTVTDTWPVLPRITSLWLLSIWSGKLELLIPQVTVSTAPEKLQVKFTEEPNNPNTVFWLYCNVNCIWLTRKENNYQGNYNCFQVVNMTTNFSICAFSTVNASIHPVIYSIIMISTWWICSPTNWVLKRMPFETLNQTTRSHLQEIICLQGLPFGMHSQITWNNRLLWMLSRNESKPLSLHEQQPIESCNFSTHSSLVYISIPHGLILGWIDFRPAMKLSAASCAHKTVCP